MNTVGDADLSGFEVVAEFSYNTPVDGLRSISGSTCHITIVLSKGQTTYEIEKWTRSTVITTSKAGLKMTNGLTATNVSLASRVQSLLNWGP